LGNTIRQESETHWVINSSNPRSFEICLKDTPVIDCVFFLSIFENEPNPMNLEALLGSQQTNEIQLLRLVKFLRQKSKINKRIDCYILTMDNYRIENLPANPYGGGLTGLAYSIAQGDHRFLVRNLDLSREDLADRQKASLLRCVLNEPVSNRGEVIKIKAKSRYGQRFFKLNWNDRHNQTGIRNEGVYVISGGSGTVGQVITRHLVGTYNANIIWIGRTPKNSDALQAKIKSFQGLGRLPYYIQADVTKPETMEHAVDEIKKNYATINGAIFSGLVLNLNNSVYDTTEAEFLETFNVKTKGSLNFYTVLQKEALDFMCFFSSIQGFHFTSSKNTSGYAAGITFADSFVKSLANNSRFPVGMINWGYWKSSISGTSMEMRLRNRFELLSDKEGIGCFESFTRLLQQQGLSQVLCLKASGPVRKLMNLERKTNGS
jgi:short-subunit dehydrogenase